MTSAYLERPLRSKPVAIKDILASLPDTYITVSRGVTGLYFNETDLGFTREKVIQWLAEGQISDPIAVLRVSRDAPTEDVTEEIANAVFAYISNKGWLYDEYGLRTSNAFLNEVEG